MTDTAIASYTTNLVNSPMIDALALSNASVKAVGNSVPIYIGNSKHVELLVNVGTKTGTANIVFHIAVLGGDATTTVKTYDGSAITSSSGTDTIMVDSSIASSPLGTYVKVTWTTSGTLDNDNWFAGVYAQLIAK